MCLKLNTFMVMIKYHLLDIYMYIKLNIMNNNKEILNVIKQLINESKEYIDNKQYKYALAKLQQAKNVLRNNNVLDDSLENILNDMHNNILTLL